MKLFKSVVVIALLGSMIISSGCTSLIRYSYSKDELIQKRIIASGDQKAIDSLRMGVSPRVIKVTAVPGGAMVGVDLLDPSTWEVLSQHPWQQLGLGILDAGMSFGTYKLGENQGWWGKNDTSTHSTSTSTTGNQNSTININQGDGQNNVQINVNTGNISADGTGAQGGTGTN